MENLPLEVCDLSGLTQGLTQGRELDETVVNLNHPWQSQPRDRAPLAEKAVTAKTRAQ